MRPTKLTPERQETIVGLLRDGVPQETAARIAGISRSTFFAWKQQGSQEDPDPMFSDFLDAVEGARAEAEAAFIGVIWQAAQAGDWRAAAWWLDRARPERWAQRPKAEITLEQARAVVDAEIMRLEAEFADEN